MIVQFKILKNHNVHAEFRTFILGDFKFSGEDASIKTHTVSSSNSAHQF